MYFSKVLALLMVLAVVVSACVPVPPPGDQPRADALRYAQRGPYAVGYRPLVIDAGTDHELAAGLWYPAHNPAGVEEVITYEFMLKPPDLQSDTPATAQGQALLEAAIDEQDGPYPLVIFSHGFSANAAWYHTLLEHLASYGLLVLAPEHREQEWMNSGMAAIARPQDIRRVLDFSEQLAAPDANGGSLPIDMARVAMVGHSYGGYTALAMAGAQFDFVALQARCAGLAAEDPHTFLCMPLVGKEAELAAQAGWDAVPDGLWPSMGDPRVTAILPMASDAYLFGAAGLAMVTAPMLALGGTADTGTPIDWGSQLAYDAVASPAKTLVTLEGAEHMVMGSPCETMPWTDGIPFSDYICQDPVWEKHEALDLVHHFSTAFLLATLQDDADAHAALLPAAVDFSGVGYVTTLE